MLTGLWEKIYRIMCKKCPIGFNKYCMIGVIMMVMADNTDKKMIKDSLQETVKTHRQNTPDKR